jgi:hypothetical protein
MPNWCANTLTLTHEDASKIDALEAELNRDDGKFFEFLRPNPSGQWDYGWSVDNWGTKWEAEVNDWERDGNTIMFYHFDTAWGPPVALYDYLTENGWEVEAMYHEPGVQCCGIYSSDGGDDYYEYNFEDFSPEGETDIPEELIEWAGIRREYEDLREANENREEQE